MERVYSILLKDGTWYEVPPELLDELRAMYSNADDQLQRLVNWSADVRNAAKRKTRRGAPSFIRRNLARRGAVKYRVPSGAPLPVKDAVRVDAMAKEALATCRAMLAHKMKAAA